MQSVSVIICNWNGKHLLKSCLSSLRKQTFDAFEVVLVDNGSTDGSVEYVREHFPEVKLIKLMENHGFCGGNNVGIQATTSDFVVLLNNDTEVEPNWLEELYRVMSASPEIGCCDSKVLFFDQRDMIDTMGGIYTIAGSAERRGYLQRDRGQFDRAVDTFTAVASAVMYRRDMLERIGLLDEGFYFGYEDVDLSFRAHLFRYRCVNVPAAKVYHKVSASSYFNSEFYVYYGQRNVSYVFIKNMPGPLFWKYLPLHLMYVAGSFGYFARIGKSKAFFKAKIDVLKNLGSILRKRRKIQRMRTATVDDIDCLLERKWFQSKWKKLTLSDGS